MITICEQFAESHSITFNPSKTKLLCFNMKLESKVPPIYLNGERVSIVEHEKHLGNYVSTDISDRNIIADVCDLYQRSNLLISDFRVSDSITLDSLHKIYCMHNVFGYEPAGLMVHPPPQNDRGWVHFFRMGVWCHQNLFLKKADFVGDIRIGMHQNVVLRHNHLNPISTKLTSFDNNE